MKSVKLALALAVLCLVATTQATPILYSITDLGTLGGSSAAATAMNAYGQTAGFSSNAQGFTRATSNGADITPAAAGEAQASGINSGGQVVGTAYLGGSPFATIWSGTSVQYLAAGSYGLAINDGGAVTGMGANGHALVYARGVTTDLGTLAGGSWSSGYAINDAGQVAGYGDTASGAFRGFIWSAGSGFEQLGTLGGANSYAHGLNSSGNATGSAQLSSGNLHAFLYANAQMLDLGTLGGASSSGYGINAGGDVVGYSSIAGGSNHAFLYQDGAMYDLNSLLVGASAWNLTAAYAINDDGRIAGSGLLNGVEHAFRLDPIETVTTLGSPLNAVPEPSSVLLVLAGAGLMALSRFRGSAS